VKWLRRAILVIGVFIPSGLILWRVVKEVYFDYSIGKYRHEFALGMRRKDVEDRMFGEKIQFEQRNVNMIHLGQVGWSFPCGPTEVYVVLDFGAKSLSTISENDVLRSVELVRQPGGCL